ncbi:MAG: hypothetical protein WCJ37_15325 [Syntrophus sp. (in: bacteria)]
MERKFLLCIDDGGYPEALETRKFYVVREDADAEREGLIRVIDESGEDYLYSRNLFLSAELPAYVQEALAATML